MKKNYTKQLIWYYEWRGVYEYNGTRNYHLHLILYYDARMTH